MHNINSVLKNSFINLMDTEVVSIDCQRIVNFKHQWVTTNVPTKNNNFSRQYRDSEIINQLATDPLIKLLCLVVEETSEFPSDPAQIYREGLKVLLNKWDNKRYIEGDRVYKNLSLQQKQDLLSQIALKTFEWGEYFFKKDVEQYICDYLRNLHSARIHPEALEVVSEVVLKSIEAQHELIVEQTTGIYSFCDVKYQQYFAAREIIEYSDPHSLAQGLKNLVNRITEAHWREVFLLVVSMLRNGDYLLSLMKHQTNNIIASDQELQHFLIWLNQKSNTVKATCKPSTFRALYLEFILELDLAYTTEDTGDYPSLRPASMGINTCELQEFPFTERQKALLKQYYDANKLLLDCLNNARYVTRTVREEIKETLLVPLELSP